MIDESKYETNVGIEVHLQLKTNSKIFCSCPNQFGDKPNKNICPICSGYPGTLPVLNKKVVDFAVALGIATNSQISKVSEFARKHYMYPDLPKNFQITQDSKPICTDGYIPIELQDNSEKKIRLVRIHIEEDAGKNIHSTGNESFVDLNRAGTPLLEIVSHPDMASSYEAKAYLTQLRTITQYINISDANMEEGSFRADVNVSVRKKGAKTLGNRVELKNINSFKFITQAINYEVERQIELLESNKSVSTETRAWDEKEHKTIFMRSKEEAEDYRYFVEPDLPIIVVDEEWQNRIAKQLPELPHKKYHRFQKEYGLTKDETEALIADNAVANFFEQSAKLCKKPKAISNWMLRDLFAYLNEHKLNINNCKVKPETLSELVMEIDRGIITGKTAQEVFLDMANTGKYPSIIIQEKGLKQIGSSNELEPIILQIINDNPEQVAKYKAGNERLFTFFIGQAMKKTDGKGNPQIIKDLFDKHLKM